MSDNQAASVDVLEGQESSLEIPAGSAVSSQEIPAGLVQYKNGVIADKSTGLFVRGSPVITSERAYELHAIRRQRAIESIEQGIIEGANVSTVGQGLVKLAVAQTRIALDDSKGRASTEAYKALLVSGGFVPTRGESSASPGSNTLSLSNDVLLRLVGVLSDELSRRGSSNREG